MAKCASVQDPACVRSKVSFDVVVVAEVELARDQHEVERREEFDEWGE